MKFLIGFLSLLVISFQASHAKVVARVIEAKGNSFVFMGKDVRTLNYGSSIEDLSEIMVEDSSALSIVNNAGQVFHIRGGSLVKVYEGLLELKNGNVWGTSEVDAPYIISTPNSIAKYTDGEFIASFDNITGKSQLLVLIGKMKFSNALDPNLNTLVQAGQFSLVDQNYENGLPRNPTKVGLKSFKETKKLFSAFKVLDKTKIEKMLWGKKNSPKRSIASVDERKLSRAKPGRIITIKTYKKRASRGVASVSPMKYYSDVNQVEQRKRIPIKNAKTAPIRYFGVELKKVSSIPSSKTVMEATLPSFKGRVPASVKKSSFINDLKGSDFESSLKKEMRENQRHTPAVNELIDELKSYDNDYQKEY